jgi:hypothetical protein
MNQHIHGYEILIGNFVDKKISAEEFEEAYLDKYLNDQNSMSEELFQILDWLFAEVDYFSNDPETFPNDYVTAEQLHETAYNSLQELHALQKKKQ